ncbi:LysR substrate-binding domain-containing protein [Pseudomonadales bacterium]|nr:LysR substrate-binding domain-containing protein [Pseudomonadales bacterium]MDG1702865.1 LysR substrate-binding domain-containing protein [Pseudomonadales bacterium]
MNLRDLRYLVAVAEYRHFGRAAEACFVSQPTLSTQLKKLEETLGVVLFERSNRRVMLTPEGEQVVQQTQRILVELNALTALSEQLRDPMGGDLRIGIIPTIAPYLLPKVLAPLRKAFPNLKIQLTEGQTANITRMLKHGDLDATLLALPLGEENVEEVALLDEDFVFAVPADHPKAQLAEVDPSDLEGEEVLLLEDGHCFRDQALEVCQAHRGIESKSYSATSLETLRQLVAAGVGVTLIPQLAVPDEVKPSDGLRYIPFAANGQDRPMRTLGLCWRASSTRGELLQDVATLLKGCMNTL